ITTSTTSYCITFSSTTTSHATNSGVDYVVIQNNRIIGGYYGIWMYGSTGDLIRYNQVLNNEVDSAYYYGIYSYYGDSTEVVGNHVDMMSSTSTSNYGIMIYYDNNARVSANYSAAKYAAGYFYNS